MQLLVFFMLVYVFCQKYLFHLPKDSASRPGVFPPLEHPQTKFENIEKTYFKYFQKLNQQYLQYSVAYIQKYIKNLSDNKRATRRDAKLSPTIRNVFSALCFSSKLNNLLFIYFFDITATTLGLHAINKMAHIYYNIIFYINT